MYFNSYHLTISVHACAQLLGTGDVVVPQTLTYPAKQESDFPVCVNGTIIDDNQVELMEQVTLCGNASGNGFHAVINGCATLIIEDNDGE